MNKNKFSTKYLVEMALLVAIILLMAFTRELPDTVKLKETEAEAYSAVWDLMIKLEKSLPMAYIFYGQDSLVEENTRYDEIGIFLPDSLFLKNLERHVKKAEAIIYAEE